MYQATKDSSLVDTIDYCELEKAIQIKEQKIFIERLFILADEHRMTLTKLAKKLDVSNGTISNYKNGTAMPSIRVLISAAKYFNVTTDYLLGFEDCRNHETSSINNEIGLSESAINVLRAYKKISNSVPDFMYGIPEVDLHLDHDDLGGTYDLNQIEPTWYYIDTDTQMVHRVSSDYVYGAFDKFDNQTKPDPGFFSLLDELITEKKYNLLNLISHYVYSSALEDIFLHYNNGLLRYSNSDKKTILSPFKNNLTIPVDTQNLLLLKIQQSLEEMRTIQIEKYKRRDENRTKMILKRKKGERK